MGGSNDLQVMHAVIGENESGTVASQMAKKRQSTLHTLRQRRSLGGGGACKGIDTNLVRVIPQFHNAPKGPLGANGQGQTLQQTLLASKTHAQTDAPYGGGARRRRRGLLRDAMSASAPMGQVAKRLQRTFRRRPRKPRRTRSRGRGRSRRARRRRTRTGRRRTRTGRRRRRR